MKPTVPTLLYWSPRILAIAFIAFLAIFALDVFGEGRGFWETLLALLIHLIPNAIVLLALLIAWRWELIGGMLFIGLGALYIAWAWGAFPWPVYLAITGPCTIIGVLFMLNRAWPIKTPPRLAH